jgi:macrolide-specific efflux system membrane fusion protein
MMKSLLGLFVAFSILLAGCGSPAAASEATPTPLPTPVRPTFTVKRGDITVEVKLNGHVVPLALSTAYFQMIGKVHEVYANVNDAVKKGQLLGELAEAQELRAKADETRRTIRRAQIDLEIAQLTLEDYKSQGRPAPEIKIQELQVELAQMKLDETLESLGIDPNALSVTDELDAQVAQARAFAPADGTIISAVSVGQNVTTDTPAFVLGDPNQLEVIADLNPGNNEVKDMFEGMPVTVIPVAHTDVKWTGKIRQLPSPYGTGPSDATSIHVSLDSPPSASTYQTGDKVTVMIQLASKQGVLWLPPEAVRSVGGRTFVIINSDSGPKRVDVEIGLQTHDMLEIASGLQEGQVVVGP